MRRCPAAVEVYVFGTESWTTVALLAALRPVLPRTHLCAVVAGRIYARLASGDTRGTRIGARGADAAITGRSATS
ncbi:hypothetical protein ACWC09_34975 [Streptomyces sp. NPDC001617]